ncbi:MAG: DUF2953 domain-containing protein [Bacillota bacterium]|nr:DUF2953 domain-containing protein [Bacillota bacterium]
MLYIFVVVFLIILLVPIRIKLTVIYKDGKLHVYLFSKELNIKTKTAEQKVSVNTAKKVHFKLINFLPDKLRKIIYKASNNKHKLNAKLKFQLDYGFEDAALTGIFFGVLNGLSGFVYKQFQFLLKINRYEFNIVPHFNEVMFNFSANCIISFNLVKIIYMLISIYVF